MLRNSLILAADVFLCQLFLTVPELLHLQKKKTELGQFVNLSHGGLIFVNVYDTAVITCPFAPSDHLGIWTNDDFTADCNHVTQNHNKLFTVVKVICEKLSSSLKVTVLTGSQALDFTCISEKKVVKRFVIQPLFNNDKELKSSINKTSFPAGSVINLICKFDKSKHLIWYYEDGSILSSFVYCIDNSGFSSKFFGRMNTKCDIHSKISTLTIDPTKPSDGNFSIICKTNDHASRINLKVFRPHNFIDKHATDINVIVDKMTAVTCPLDPGDHLKHWKIESSLAGCNSKLENATFYVHEVLCKNEFSQIFIKILKDIKELTLYCVSNDDKMMKVKLLPQKNESTISFIVISSCSVGLVLIIISISVVVVVKHYGHS